MLLGKPLDDIQKMETGEKRGILMSYRIDQLRKLIQAYYNERGWNAVGIPTVDTLKQVGLWDYLNKDTQTKIIELIG